MERLLIVVCLFVVNFELLKTNDHTNIKKKRALAQRISRDNIETNTETITTIISLWVVGIIFISYLYHIRI
jgi:hypothetical protein